MAGMALFLSFLPCLFALVFTGAFLWRGHTFNVEKSEHEATNDAATQLMVRDAENLLEVVVAVTTIERVDY